MTHVDLRSFVSNAFFRSDVSGKRVFIRAFDIHPPGRVQEAFSAASGRRPLAPCCQLTTAPFITTAIIETRTSVMLASAFVPLPAGSTSVWLREGRALFSRLLAHVYKDAIAIPLSPIPLEKLFPPTISLLSHDASTSNSQTGSSS